jgi:hypothetical protein
MEAFPLWRHHKPSHAAALLPALVGEELPTYELSAEEFYQYLRRQPVERALPDAYGRAVRAGFPIGWLYKGRPSLPRPYLSS